MKTRHSPPILLLAWALAVIPSLKLQADGPTISAIPNMTTSEDAPPASRTFTIADADTPASSLVLSGLSSNPSLVPPTNIAFSGVGSSRVVTVMPAPNASGITTLTLTVSDAEGNTTSTSFNLVVTSVNDPPTLNALPNLTIDEGTGPQTVTLSGISSGAANETQTLAVSAASSDPSLIPNPIVTYVSPGSTGSLSVAPKTDAFGISTITVSVHDGVTASAQSFQVTVNARLQIAVADTDAVLTWAPTNAVLQQTDADRSQWMDIPSATSPYSVPFTETRFYRLRQK